MSTEELVKEVERMIKRAGNTEKSDDALKFSQAAVNAANAINVLTLITAES